jgi:hypothetical protein
MKRLAILLLLPSCLIQSEPVDMYCFQQLSDSCGDRYEYYCTYDISEAPDEPLAPYDNCTATDKNSVCCDEACVYAPLSNDKCPSDYPKFYTCYDGGQLNLGCVPHDKFDSAMCCSGE